MGKGGGDNQARGLSYCETPGEQLSLLGTENPYAYQSIDGASRRICQQTAAKYLPPGVAGGVRRTVSPTELELYQRCPRGWFLQYIARVTTAPGLRAQQGTFAHNALSAAMQAPLAERAACARAYMEKMNDFLPPQLAEEVGIQVERIIERYGAEAWPYRRHICEASLSYTHADLNGYRIRGRVDRIDVGDEDVLVIDYKLRAPQQTTEQIRSQQLQRYLYPLMAAAHLEKHPSGMLYVSISDCHHEGSVIPASPVIGNVVTDFESGAKLCMERVVDSLFRIEAGQWDEIGEHCPAYCPHHQETPTSYA